EPEAVVDELQAGSVAVGTTLHAGLHVLGNVDVGKMADHGKLLSEGRGLPRGGFGPPGGVIGPPGGGGSPREPRSRPGSGPQGPPARGRPPLGRRRRSAPDSY